MKNTQILTLSLVSLLTCSLNAAETDQFYAAKAVIKDSSKEVNGFFHERIEVALDKVNSKKNPVSCRLAAKEVLLQVVGEFSPVEYIKNKSVSKVTAFVKKSPLVERFPENDIDDKEYKGNSIYKNRPFPNNFSSIARTININGVYLGTDKISHFSIIGKTYYKNFLKGLDKGMSVEDAQEYAVAKGMKQEIALLGYKIGGTLSYGDLEANYQGLVFGRDMCEGEKPYLISVKGRWVHNPESLFDIKKYVNPKYDEAYNVSVWAPRTWKNMKKDIVESFCKNKDDADYKARAAEYDKVIQTSYSDLELNKFLAKNPKYDRKNQLLSADIKCE
jgi:hypothetical protein